MGRPLFNLLLATICLATAAAGAKATEAAAPFAAETVADRNSALAALRDGSPSPDAAMTLATWQACSSIERFGQALHHHGFRSPRTALVPLMRLPIPENQDYEALTYESWRDILAELVAGLDEAKSMFEAIDSNAGIALDVDLRALRFDLDADGMLDESESVAAIFEAINNRGRIVRDRGSDASATESPALSFRFDRADAYWLQGYANFLTANARMWLAHDFSSTFESSFQLFFPQTGIESQVPVEADTPDRRLADVIRQNLYLQLKFAKSAEAKEKLTRQIEALTEAERIRQQLEAKVAFDKELERIRRGPGRSLIGKEIFDAISLIHTVNWPVADARARARVRLDLLEMVRLSRLNWQSIRSETDNEREWLPGPQQKGPHPLTNLEVTDATVAAWHEALDLFEAVLEGRILVPHMRFEDMGMNLKRFFEEPAPFDLVLTLTGPGALPYLETGEQASQRQWREIGRAFGRNGFFAYAIWFN